jgi:gamma-glutamyl:cysteine ligase YbdK (ATP-grasp superfamily)
MLRLFEGFGIELEYMLVDARTLAVAPRADWLLGTAAGAITGEYCDGAIAWNNELALHVLELKLARPSPVLDPLPDLFQAQVGRIDRLLEAGGLRLMPTGMHPWMDPARELHLWPHDNGDIYRAFDRIFACKGHGWANLQSMHVNLPFADDGEFHRLHAAIRFLLPLLPGLAASSPVMDGATTGTADNRLAVYRGNCARVPSVTGAVVPEPVAGIAEYQRRILGRIYADLAPHDPQGLLAQEWVNARGAIARFERMAIEIRVLDVQECPAMDLAFAGLIVAALRELCDDPGMADSLDAWRTADLARYFDAVVRDGERTEIHDRRYLRWFGCRASSLPVHAVWGELAERAAARGQLDPAAERAIEHYLRHGTLATRIVASLPREPRREDLAAVYRELCDCLAEGRPFVAIRPVSSS